MTTQQLCKALNISQTTAIRWAKEGCPNRRTDRGRLQWDLQAARAWSKATIKSPTPSDPSFNAARTRKEMALAEKHELDLSVRRGELISLVEVNRLLFIAARQMRDAFQQLPDRLAGPLSAERDQFKVYTAMAQETKRILDDLAKSLRTYTFDPTLCDGCGKKLQ